MGGRRGKKWLTQIPSVTLLFWPRCSPVCYTLYWGAKRAAGAISLLRTASAEISQGFVVVTQVGSTVRLLVLQHLWLFAGADTVATGVRLSPPQSLSISHLLLGGRGCGVCSPSSFSWSIDFSSPPPLSHPSLSERVLAKQPGLAPKHNYENGPLGCFF